VRAVVLTGTGGAFCSGADVTELQDAAVGRDDGLTGINSIEPRAWLVECPKPVVVAVDGAAVGLGAELACQADVRLATPRATFAWNFVLRGLVPDTGAATWLLPRIVGLSAALSLVYTGEVLSAGRAAELGFVTELVEPGDLLDAAIAVAARFAAGSPFAIRRVKELIYGGLGRGADKHLDASTAALVECFSSLDFREGVAAFMERREPAFVGR
jgi:enoyl-CoA hydratase/carnithine racemase